jgi:hypothetical protein
VTQGGLLTSIYTAEDIMNRVAKNVLQCGTNDHYYWHIISRLEPLQVVLQECKARFSYTRQSFI